MDLRIQIRIRIHTKMSWNRNTGSTYERNAALRYVLSLSTVSGSILLTVRVESVVGAESVDEQPLKT
jgi:hypothetical protein